jgi:curved DNA-binding protein CbpA
MTEQLDPYAVLGVAPDATDRDINHAYRQLLHRYHPDTRPPRDEDSAADAADRLQQILTAYTPLRDPTWRANYYRETVRRRRVRNAKRPRPRSIFMFGDVFGEATWSEADIPLRVGPVQWHNDPNESRK